MSALGGNEEAATVLIDAEVLEPSLHGRRHDKCCDWPKNFLRASAAGKQSPTQQGNQI